MLTLTRLPLLVCKCNEVGVVIAYLATTANDGDDDFINGYNY